MFRIVKGGIEELFDDLKNKAAGIRTFPTGFEALMKTENISGFPNQTVEPATIDEIVVFTSGCAIKEIIKERSPIARTKT